MNGLQALPQWHVFMNNPAGAWLGFINAIYWLGNGVTYPIAALVANKYGRKLGVYIGYCFLVLGVILQTAAKNEITFVLARLFLGRHLPGSAILYPSSSMKSPSRHIAAS
jgi:MFS family permease